MTESESLEPYIVGIDGVEVPFCGADLGDLFSAYYHLPQRRLQKEKRRDGHSVGWTPSEDAAMVRASVEVTMVDDLDVEDAEIAASTSTTSSGVGLSGANPMRHPQRPLHPTVTSPSNQRSSLWLNSEHE
jgi:hypothetical protein